MGHVQKKRRGNLRVVEGGFKDQRCWGERGVTGIGRGCNLGVLQGDGGWAKYLRVLHLVPRSKYVYREVRERERKKT